METDTVFIERRYYHNERIRHGYNDMSPTMIYKMIHASKLSDMDPVTKSGFRRKLILMRVITRIKHKSMYIPYQASKQQASCKCRRLCNRQQQDLHDSCTRQICS